AQAGVAMYRPTTSASNGKSMRVTGGLLFSAPRARTPSSCKGHAVDRPHGRSCPALRPYMWGRRPRQTPTNSCYFAAPFVTVGPASGGGRTHKTAGGEPDCPPAVGLLTFNALKACSEAIVPMDPSFFALHGIGKLLETFEVLVKDTGHQIVPRVLVTLYPGRSPFVKAVVDEIRHHLDGRH